MSFTEIIYGIVILPIRETIVSLEIYAPTVITSFADPGEPIVCRESACALSEKIVSGLK
jgi:hypothetical protein